MTTVATPAPVGLRGSVRSDLRKIVLMSLTWIMLAVGAVIIVGFSVIIASTSSHPLTGRSVVDDASIIVDRLQFVVQIALGIVFLPLSAQLVGMEYSTGLIRLLFGRGMGRVQFYLAKLASLALLAAAALGGAIVVTAVYSAIVLGRSEGGLGFVASLPDWWWHNLAVLLGIEVLSLITVILLGAAASATRRSLAAGLSLALCFFPADNLGTLVVRMISGRNAWLAGVPDFLLGPNLNHLRNGLQVNHVQANHLPPITFIEPIDVTGLHSLLVVAGWDIILLLVPLLLISRRDVRE